MAPIQRIPTDILVIRTNPPTEGAVGAWMTRPQPLDRDAVFCCFFRSRLDRTSFASYLKLEAGSDGKVADPAAEYAECVRRSDAPGALAAAVRLQCRVNGEPYQTYSLLIGAGPYPLTLVVSFRELAPAVIRANHGVAAELLLAVRSRVIDAFGLQGYGVAEEPDDDDTDDPE